LGIYLVLARVLGVRELAEVERMALQIRTRSRA
jgi:hypothetical protein